MHIREVTVVDIFLSFLHCGPALAYAGVAAAALASAVVLLRRPVLRRRRFKWPAVAALLATSALFIYFAGMMAIFQSYIDHPAAPVERVPG